MAGFVPSRDAVLGLVDPWIFMSISLSYLPPTILSFLRAGDLRALTSWSTIKAAWFGRFCT